MLGHSHALSGAAAGLAAGIVLGKSLSQDAALSGLTAGMALLPDMDQVGSCASRSLGFVSSLAAHAIRKVSGGHRHATHSLLGVAVFTGLAWLACAFRYDIAGKAGLGFLVVIAVAGGLEALHLARGHVSDIIGVAVAAGVIWFGWLLALIPLAVAVGCAAHLLGDCCTVQGCPLIMPLRRSHQFALPGFLRFTTSHWQETRVVVPLLYAALLVLGVQAADPSAWTALAGALR